MKLKQLFLLALALVMLTMVLASCELPFDLPFDIPFLGGGETTTADTTTAPATTTGAIITLPAVTAKPNPIVEVKKVSERIRLIHKNNTVTSIEAKLEATDIYNAITYTHSLDKESGILTLVLSSDYDKNNALSALVGEVTTLTVRIRESNKKLEWAYEGREEWTVLCSTGDTNSQPLTALREATGFGEKVIALEAYLAATEEYNGVVYTPSYNAESGILTLTMYDRMVENIALIHLQKDLPAPLTVCLRKNGDNLEWAYPDSDAWTLLCSVTDKTATPLALLREATNFARHTMTTETSVYFTINNNKFRFRATEWKPGYDFVTTASLYGSSNQIFNMDYHMEVASSQPYNDMSSGTTWKGAGDDITPININGTYIGANHGYFIIAAVPNPADNKKTEKDIGSIWAVGDQQYVLVKVDVVPKEDKNGPARLWFCPISDSMMASGKFSNHSIGAGATIEHVSGATNKKSIVTTEASLQCQYYIALNHVKMAAFLNGTVEVDITKNGVYSAEFVDFYEEYDIIYLPDMLQYLIDNVGNNTNDSHHDESLKESYVTFRNTYRYHKNGACVVYSSYAFHKDVSVSYIGGVQSGPFSESSHYVYVPGANGYTTPTFQNGKNEGTFPNVNIGKDLLVTPGQLTTTYFQLTSPDGAKAMNLGFNPLFGWGQNDLRTQHVGSGADALAFYYQNSYKMYPKLISGGTLKAGTTVDCIAYRLPSYKMDDDFFAINWYWVGDDIFLSLHTDHAVAEKTVSLPEYMNGMTITPVEKSDSFNIVSETIDNGITVSTSGNGYTIVKLSPAN